MSRGVLRAALFRWLGAVLGWLVGEVLRVRRRHVVAAMRRAGIGEVPRQVRRMYASLGTGLLELLWVLRGGGERALPELRLVGLDRAPWIGSGKAAVVATAHTGSWDLAACALARQVGLVVVTKRLSVRWLDRLWQRGRGRLGLGLIDVGWVVRAGQEALGRGALLAMLIDQAPERSRGAVVEPFLGAPAYVDLAPALLAMRARVPLVVAFPRRAPDGRHEVCIVGVLEPPARPSRAWAEASMRQVTRWLEAFVREQPEQWLWMHRRWKGAPDPGALN